MCSNPELKMLLRVDCNLDLVRKENKYKVYSQSIRVTDWQFQVVGNKIFVYFFFFNSRLIKCTVRMKRG